MRNGFSLIELLVVITVLAVLTSLAAPSFRSIVADNLVKTSANELFYAIQLARNEAVKRNTMVSICPSSNQSSCTSNGNWNVGWIIFEDVNASGSRDNSETLIRVQTALDSSVAAAGPTAIQFATGGYLEPAAVQSVQVSAADSANPRWVCLTAIGKAQVQATSC